MLLICMSIAGTVPLIDPTEEDYQYLAEETKKDVDWVKKAVEEIKASL